MQKEDLLAGKQRREGLGVSSGLKAEHEDNIRCPFLTTVSPAAKAIVLNSVAYHLLPPQVSASSYLLFPYLGLLNR